MRRNTHKKSRVIGVHKRANRAQAKNYRHIVGLNALDNQSLCFETVVGPQFDSRLDIQVHTVSKHRD